MADMEVMANDKATESTRKTHTSPNHEATTLGQLHCISWLVHMTDSHRYLNISHDLQSASTGSKSQLSAFVPKYRPPADNAYGIYTVKVSRQKAG